MCDNFLKAENQNYVVTTKDLLSLAMESIILLGHVNFFMNKMTRVRNTQKDLYSLCEAVILLPLCFQGITSQRKSGKRRSHQNLLHVPFLNCRDTQDIKTRKGKAKQRISFCPRATNTKHYIAYNRKTTDNTGINKHIKHKAHRHTICQDILQIQE